MIHLTLTQSGSVISMAGALWLMVRAGTAKRQLRARVRPRCASCGRRFTGTCVCATRVQER